MPESAAAVAAPAAPNAISAPVAGETFAQQMDRLGGFTNASGDEIEVDAEPSAPAPDAADAKIARAKASRKTKPAAKSAPAAKPAVAAAVEAAPAAAVAAATPAIDKLEQFRTLAKELDFEISDTAVTARERFELREQKRLLNQRIEQQESEVLARLNDAKTQFSEELTFAQKIKQAKASGDYEGIAKLLGSKDWNGLQEDVIAQISDPNYKRLRELEEYRQKQEEQEALRSQEQERQTLAQQRVEARKQHEAHLTKQMAASSDPLVAAMHDDPQFIAAVIEVQRQNWDGRTTVTPEKAIKIAAQGFAGPLEQHMRGLYTRLQKAFGTAQATAIVQAAAPQLAAATGAPTASGVARSPIPAAKKNKTAVVPDASVDAAAVAAKPLTKKEKDLDFSRRLREAIAEE